MIHEACNLLYSPCLILDQRPFCTAETTGPVSFIQRGDTRPIQTINEMFFNYEALVICQQSQLGVQRVDSFHDRVVLFLGVHIGIINQLMRQEHFFGIKPGI